MCYNGVAWLFKVCYNVAMADSVYYNMFCIADMLQCEVSREGSNRVLSCKRCFGRPQSTNSRTVRETGEIVD